MQVENTDCVEAVILFADEQIARELLYPEFEAILDGFIPMPDFNDSTIKAVYVVVNANLCITSAVFFLIDFDSSGMVDRRWNVPLQHLVQIAARGPNLGAGAIRLACFSQCAIELQKHKLWDPQMEPGNNCFSALKKTIKNNRLGLAFKPEAKQPSVMSSPTKPADNEHQQFLLQQKLHGHYSQELRDRLAAALKEQRLRIATLHSKHVETVKKLQHEHQQRLQFYQERVQKLETEQTDIVFRNQSLKEMLDVQAGKVAGIREYFEFKLQSAQLDESSQQQTLQDNISLEIELKIQAATTELREQLDIREMELFYRNQNELSLKDEIDHLMHEQQALLNSSSEQLLTRLNKAGVNFVVYHLGVGQFAVGLEDLSRYLESPTAFVADKLGVTESHYSHWLLHYQNPLCCMTDSRGKTCAKAIVRIGSVLEFHEGESDHCEQHQRMAHQHTAVLSVMSMLEK